MAACFAFASQTDTVTGINTRRYFHRQGLVLFDATFAVAGVTRIGNDLALAMAPRAGLLHREETLLHAHLTDTATGRASHRRGAFLGARAIARFAVDQCWHTDIHRRAAHRFFQVQLQRVPQVTAALSAATGTTATATEEVTEDITKDIGEVLTTKTGTTATQYVSPNLILNFSARFSAAERFSVMANVVDPLPDMSVAAAPFSRRKS